MLLCTGLRGYVEVVALSGSEIELSGSEYELARGGLFWMEWYVWLNRADERESTRFTPASKSTPKKGSSASLSSLGWYVLYSEWLPPGVLWTLYEGLVELLRVWELYGDSRLSSDWDRPKSSMYSREP